MNILEKATFPQNDVYHAGPGMSWSKFKRFLASPIQYDYLFGKDGVGVKESPAMSYGSFVHSLVLEPELTSTFFRPWEEMPLRKKEEKKAYIDWLVMIDAAEPSEEETLMTLKADELRAVAKSSPTRFLSHEDYAKGKRIAELLRPYFPDVRKDNVEAAFYAEIEGVQCKCKCDHIDDSGQIKDIKCAGQLDKWLTSLEFGDLLCGDAFYRLVIKEATGKLPPPIEYVGVSTTEPFQVCVRKHETDFGLAEMRIRDGLNKYKECMESGLWPGIDETPEAKPVEIRTGTIDKFEKELGLDDDQMTDILFAGIE